MQISALLSGRYQQRQRQTADRAVGASALCRSAAEAASGGAVLRYPGLRENLTLPPEPQASVACDYLLVFTETKHFHGIAGSRIGLGVKVGSILRRRLCL